MSNYDNELDKINSHLEELYKKHRKLDDEIKDMHTHFDRDELINRKKTEKLWLKDEIFRLERLLHDHANGFE